MIEIASSRIWVGDDMDFLSLGASSGWSVLHAAKEPYHRAALGYTGRGAPKEHPEYLVARRGSELMLNLIDVNDKRYIHPDIIKAALDFISEEIGKKRQILVHCNQGKSRSPSIVLLYLHRNSDLVPQDFKDALQWMAKQCQYAPSKGILEYLEEVW